MAAMFVSSTGRRAVTRRSHSGSGRRSSCQPHTSSTSTPKAMQPIVRAESQPQELPLETPTKVATRPTARPMAPPRSKMPSWASWTCGTRNQVPRPTSTARPVATQKSACQSPVWAIQAESGRPIAPPTPRVALIAATAVVAIAGGTTSRIRLMPTGMKPIARPCRARPATTGPRVEDRAQVREPAKRRTELPTSTRCLPKRSARRPAIGIATAAPSSVAVTTHAALEGVVLRNSGSSVWIGMTSVCMSATLMPLKHRTITVSTALRWSWSTSGSASLAVFISVTMCILHMHDAHRHGSLGHMATRVRRTTEQSLLGELADELLRFSKRRHGSVDGTELDSSAFKLLWVLSDDEPRTLRELADELDLDLSTINRQVNAAVRAGLLERFTVTGSPSKPVRPTAAGRRQYEHDLAVHSDRLRSVLAEMGADAARDLLRGLRAFNDAYDRRAPRRARD